jgi:ATP-dependent DNA helicase PIF1
MEEEPVLSHDQLFALDVFKSGENFYLGAGGGFGKSFLIEQFKKYAESIDKRISIAALTGVASILLGPEAKTINSWAGIGIGNAPVDTIINNIRTKGRYSSYVRWKMTDILVIDEVSMMSCEMFELLDTIGRQIRGRGNKNKPFGGIQLVLCGDFCQLPPVVKSMDKSGPLYIFESSIWPTIITQNVFLTTNHRQSDPVFAQLLDEVRFGILSPSSKEILKSRIGLDYSTLEIKPTFLHSRNVSVDEINNREMLKLGNEIITFHIQNATLDKTGNENCINYSSREILASVAAMDKNQQYVPELKLCVDAQVMLLVNLDITNGLANGSRGVIKSFSENGYPIVLFCNERVVEITPYTWYGEQIERTQIGRIQIPLKLAYAITIHKIQGSTLDCALINLKNIFEDGQAYVALSRVRDLIGLYILDIDYSKIRASKKVVEFYNTER